MLNVDFARANVAKYSWARAIVEGWREEVTYALEQGRDFFEEMIAELTLWPEYGQNCPVCVGKMSSMGECGIYQWDVGAPDRLVCSYCKTEYPNADYPETGSVTAPRMGQTFTFYETDEERAHPHDRSGRYAFKWVNYPVHTSWSGVLRSKRATWCVEQMELLAKLYAVVGEVECAERAAWILDIFAQRYPNWLFHAYDGTVADLPPAAAAAEMGRNPRGGKFAPESIISAFEGRHQQGDHAVLCNGFWGAGRLGCSGSDSGFLLEALRCYQLVRPARYADGRAVLTPEMERRICQDLLIAGWDDTEHWDEINNKCGRGRALSGAMGMLFERPHGVRRALEGLEKLMEEAFHFDGFCTESPSYSDMHLNLMRDIPEVLVGYAGLPDEAEVSQDFDPFARFDRYRLALESMVRMLDPSLQYPVIGDTHRGGGIQAIHAEVLTYHYNRRYAALLEKAQGAPLSQAGGEYALWHRDPDLQAEGEVELPLRSEWFPGWRVAVLRGNAVKEHTAFYLNGYAHGGHRHCDTLGIIYIAHGREMAADRGYIWDDPRNAWCRSTLSHNIVTVDGDNQNGAQCRSTLGLFGRGAGIEVVQASANAYEQCDQYNRLCALVEMPGQQSYVVDIFRVRGGQLHQYGFHCNGRLVGVDIDLQAVEEEIEWLENLRAAQPQGPFTTTWEHEGARLDLTVLNPVDRVLVADAPGWRSDRGDEINAPPVQEVLAERRGGEVVASRYAAVMAPYEGGASPILSARLLVDDADNGVVGVAVERQGGTDYILSSLEGRECQCGPMRLVGRFAFASVDAQGQTLRSYLLDGTLLQCGDVRLELAQSRTALAVDAVEGRTFHLAESAPTDREIVGAYLLANQTGFEIEAVGPQTLTVRDYPAVECDEVVVLNEAAVLKA